METALVSDDKTKQLEQAFTVFNQLSEQLADTYHDLEDRVTALNSELAEAHNERLQELAEKERLADRLESLLTALPAGVVVLDNQGRVQEANPAAEGFLGSPLVGSLWREVILRAFETEGNGYDLKLKDGRLVSLTTCPLASEPGQILMLNDVTERRLLQEQVSRQQRLSAMGEMAASLAHQIRTPLASALLYTSHLKGPLDEDKRLRFVDKVMDSIRHLEKLVSDMLIYARGEMGGGEDLAVTQLLSDLEQALEGPLQTSEIVLSIADQSNGALIRCNREMLISAIMNLANNAIELMAGKGELTVSAREAEDGYIDISVRDSGPGIGEAERERIFEPFYTTREKGTGLGLAVVQAVARAHRGDVWLESTLGEGAEFGLRLPARRGE